MLYTTPEAHMIAESNFRPQKRQHDNKSQNRSVFNDLETIDEEETQYKSRRFKQVPKYKKNYKKKGMTPPPAGGSLQISPKQGY